MKQEKWDKLNKELDDALESGFDTAKVALRRYLLENKEKVASDLEEMRKKSSESRDQLEEAAANLADPNICKTDNWIAGAQWQAERMYSEEEVLQLLLRLQQTESYDNLYDWFEQFKKK